MVYWSAFPKMTDILQLIIRVSPFPNTNINFLNDPTILLHLSRVGLSQAKLLKKGIMSFGEALIRQLISQENQ